MTILAYPRTWPSSAVLVGAVILAACGEPTEPASLVASVEITSPIDTLLASGKTVQLTATPRDAAGAVVSGLELTWTASNPAVASVSAAGLVTGLAAGTSVITASTGAVSGTLRLRVVGADLEAITAVLTDPVVSHLLSGVGASARGSVVGAINAATAAAGSGDLGELQRQLAVARAVAVGAGDPDDVALLAVLDLVLGFAEARLGL